MNKILIISFVFPPSPSVGARRWTKFNKYLSRQNIKTHVISSYYKSNNINFKKDLKDVNFTHTILPSSYPKYINRVEYQKKTLLSKIMFRVQHYLIKNKVKGNYWDLSVNWKKHFRITIPQIIKNENIEKVIISGPPYRYVYYACKLKTLFPNLELILDYRDPWNDLNNPKHFEQKRNDYEINLEKKTLKKVDKIITVSEFQKTLIQDREPNCAPVYVIPNGYDFEDYSINVKKIQESEKITLTHFGTLHQQKDYYWIPFLKAYLKLKKNNIELYNKLEVNLVGYSPPEIIQFIKNNKLNIKIFGMLPPKEAFDILNQADIALWFKYDNSPGDFATKFGDYVALNKFMWTFSVKGAVTNFIEQHKIGKVFYRNTENLEQEIYNAFLNIEDKKNRTFDSNYDFSILNIENITKELIKVIEL